jgi:hypothetical protein
VEGPCRLPAGGEELVGAYGDRPHFLGLSVNDLDSYEATPEYVTD